MSFKTIIGIKKLGQNVIDIILKNIEEIVPNLPEKVDFSEEHPTDIQQILDLFGDLFYDNSGVKRLVSFVQFGNVYLAKVVDVTSPKPYVFLAYNIYDVIHRFNASTKKPVQYIKLYESKYDCDYIVTNDNTTFNFCVIFTKKKDKSVESDLYDTSDAAEVISFTCVPTQIQVNRFYQKVTPIIIDDKISGTLVVDINGTIFKVPYSIDEKEETKPTFLSLISSIPQNKINYALKATNSIYDFSYVIDSYKLEKVNDIENEPRYISFENAEYLEGIANGSIKETNEEIYVESGIWKATAALRKVCEVTVVDNHGIKHSQYVDFNTTSIKNFLERNEYYKELLDKLINSDEYIESYSGLKKNDTMISETQMIMDHITIIPNILKKEVEEPIEDDEDTQPELPFDPEPTEPEIGEDENNEPSNETNDNTNQTENDENKDETENPENSQANEEVNKDTVIDETGILDEGTSNENNEG